MLVMVKLQLQRENKLIGAYVRCDVTKTRSGYDLDWSVDKGVFEDLQLRDGEQAQAASDAIWSYEQVKRQLQSRVSDALAELVEHAAHMMRDAGRGETTVRYDADSLVVMAEGIKRLVYDANEKLVPPPRSALLEDWSTLIAFDRMVAVPHEPMAKAAGQ